ncbi:DUF4395 domain-containing protein [Chloroflexota bacterium]
MKKIIGFGEKVEGYDILVLNERELRATAGILFLMMYTSIMIVIFENQYLMLKYAILIFLTDFIIRVFVNPKFSPTLIIGRMIVKNQVPEYVGAQQKKFAWIIGVIISATMFILIGILNFDNFITTLLCYVCLIFLFFEAAFGICIGCKIYTLAYKEKAQYCPGEVCDLNSRQEIQKTSKVQKFIVLGFIAYIFLIGFMFYDFFLNF